MKKAFSLVEVVIAITIFMILILFLYKTLDQTKHTNKLFEDKKTALENKNRIYNIFLEDIAEIKGKTTPTILQDRDKNSRFMIESNNTYHNTNYNHIAYMISSNSKLVRVESFEKLIKSAQDPVPSYDFYEKAYIDILLDEVEYFEVSKKSNNKGYLFVIKQKNKDKIYLNTYKF